MALGAIADDLRSAVARRLERGVGRTAAERLASAGWEAWTDRTLARPLDIPTGVRLVGVGSAVLGGAGKTPVAIALVRALATRGERAAVIGHAYRASPRVPRVVRPGDPVGLVGDDALAAARLLDGAADVVVAPTRQAAVDHAASLGHRWLVLDGPLQTAPERLDLAVLVLDAARPWGGGACPPVGDLRASRAALLRAADVVALVDAGGEQQQRDEAPRGAVRIPTHIAGGVSADGEAASLEAVSALRVGLLLTIARPERVVAALERAGIRPAASVRLADHGVPSAGILAEAARAPVDAWLTTARCATKLPADIGGRPVLALDHRVDVTALVARLATDAGG
jgi:tetraacyldisaccharide 4'-kinase